MNYRIRLWLGLLLVLLLTWIDYQYFTEGTGVTTIPETKRRLFHLLFFAAIIPAGYWGWYSHPAAWIKRIWLIVYLTGFVLVLMIGSIQWIWQPFSVAFLDQISAMRMLFISPAPYLILLTVFLVTRRR